MTTTSIPTRTPRRRKLVITLGAVLLILVGYTTWANLRTVTLTHSVDIAAPTSVVWEVLTDLEAYPQWNPFMVEAAGSVSEGDKLTILLRDAAGDDMEISPVLITVDENRELRWLGSVPPGLLFDGEHRFELRPLPTGGTRLTQTEDFTGALVPPMTGWLTDNTLPQFAAMNEALAQRAESLSG